MPHRRAFTIVQLLVILAIIGFLFGLLVPILARVRQEAARSVGMNNMRQIVLAVHNYHDSFNAMPPMVGTVNNQSGTVHFHILPFVEQDALYRAAEGDVTNKGTNGVVVSVYIDPHDQSAPPNNKFNDWLATTNYAGNWLVFKTGEMRFQNITDGTSNTLMFTQRYQMCNGTPTAWGYNALYTWAPMFGYYNQGRFQSRPAQSECDPTLAQSFQPGGIQVVLCDGSSRNISEAMSPQTWWYLTDPADGNVLGADFND